MLRARDGWTFSLVIYLGIITLLGQPVGPPIIPVGQAQAPWQSPTLVDLPRQQSAESEGPRESQGTSEGWRAARENSSGKDPISLTRGSSAESSPRNPTLATRQTVGVDPSRRSEIDLGASPASRSAAGAPSGWESVAPPGPAGDNSRSTGPPLTNTFTGSSPGTFGVGREHSSPISKATPGQDSQGDWLPAESSPGASRPAGANAAPISLPAPHGQVWREYDIRPYTTQVRSTKRPEAALVEWILRETGYEIWHGEVVAILNATAEKLFVYHTPEIQNGVAEVVQRFTANGGEPIILNLRLIVLSHPGWQASWLHALTPMRVQSGGIRAWVLHREDASLLLADFRRRPDYREHHVPQVSVSNGQTTVVSATKARPYLRTISWRPEVWPGFSPETAFLDEGFVLELSPLLSVDKRQIDLALKLEIQQVERLVALPLEIASAGGQPSRPRVEIPQRAQLSLHERFRWTVDQALLVDLGMVPVPIPVDTSRLSGWPWPFTAAAPRGNVLLLIEARPFGSSSTASKAPPATPSGINRLGY
jgi:hypothetical protein